MYISKIKLTNWRNFREADIDLTHRIFIVGPNASGKSNLLDVIRFLRDIAKQAGGLQHAVEERGGVSKIHCLAAGKKSDVGIEVHLSDSADVESGWIYRLVFKHSGGGMIKDQAVVVEEKVWSNEKEKWILDREEKSKNEDTETLKFTHLEQPISNTAFRKIYHFFKEIQYLNIVPQLVRDAESYILSANKEDYYGRNLLEIINKTNSKTRDAYIGRINEVLTIAVPQLKELRFKKDANGIPHLEAGYMHWRSKGARQQEAQFSDGTLRLIGFMWALLDGQETILLEEPELYLHTAIIKQLPAFIKKLQGRKNKIRQVIITTHSYDLLTDEGIGADEMIVLEPTHEGTLARRADQIEEIKRYLDSGFSMADATIPASAPGDIERLHQIKAGD
jgi:predicted ATPase